ncbi:MAG: hypothetical protein K6F61_04330 [Clostridiales bacterium]|nr:hypothetical protein [Clostridiales bacterium]
MKKILCICICLILALLSLSAAGADTLPDIDSLLIQGCSERTEVLDDLSGYSIANDSFSEITGDTVKLLFLERRSPEKEFTALKQTPPLTGSEGFPDDFEGYDVGPARIWLRGDLMARLPENLRAHSLEEATHIFIAEDIYFYASTLISYDYSKRDDLDPPEFETTEEMTAYFLEHQPVLESVTYYPAFSSYAFLTLYETGTKRCSIFDAKETPCKWFARNREASVQWSNMSTLITLEASVEAGPDYESADALKNKISNLDFVPDVKKTLWSACLDQGRFDLAAAAITEHFWVMAEELKNLDPSEKNRKNYDLIIAARDAAALGHYVNFCDYSGFEKSIDLIESEKEYLAAPDWDWLEESVQGTVNELSE